MTADKPLRELNGQAGSPGEAAIREPRHAGEHHGSEHGGSEHGGEPACWAHLVCPECGAVISDGHRTGCPAGPAAPGAP